METTYIVAKLENAPIAGKWAFVARSELVQPHWIILDRVNSFTKACAIRDAANGAV